MARAHTHFSRTQNAAGLPPTPQERRSAGARRRNDRHNDDPKAARTAATRLTTTPTMRTHRLVLPLLLLALAGQAALAFHLGMKAMRCVRAP